MDKNLTIVTPVYAAVFAFVFVLLSVRTLLLRRRLGVAIGHAEQPALARAVRAHANFVEYVPLALILIFFFETTVGSGIGIHILCALLLLGRLSHAYGISQLTEDYKFRVLGMALTFTTIISAAARIVVAYIS
jgi:uncharacterized membrane protein YecN with MAPEG domain